jgi:predicted Zn-dependent protease with MMP-like domain
MIRVSDEHFHEVVERAVTEIPKRYKSHLENVAFMVADEPSPAHLRASGRLHGRSLLLGLYEGIPLPSRGNGYNGVMPDVITVFQKPHEILARDEAQLAAMVHDTVWHEVAHYFGLGHGAIRRLEGN